MYKRQVQKGANDYVMVYESVNGADKSISDGLTSSFFVDDEGRLDFTHCEKIYYGSASATTTSDSSDAKLLAVKIPEGYEPVSYTHLRKSRGCFTVVLSIR